MVFIEVQNGDYLGKDDIMRYKDNDYYYLLVASVLLFAVQLFLSSTVSLWIFKLFTLIFSCSE